MVDRCTLFQRESGVLLDIPSLPGAYGIGEIGPHALKFLQLLHDTGQKLWHIVSLHTSHPERLHTGTSYGWNTLLISLAWLRDDGLAFPEELQKVKIYLEQLGHSREAIYRIRQQFLSHIAGHFEQRASQALITDFLAFQKYHHLWLNKFSLFQSLKETLGGTPWYTWPEHLRSFEPHAINAAQKQLVEKIQQQNILQFLFMRYWERLRNEAHYLGIRIILTVPTFVLHDSYEVWSNQSLFFVNDEGQMTATSGLPPSPMMPQGKLFQGPQYHWNRLKTDQYKFWINRFRRELQVVDIALWEHFSALFETHEFPSGGEENPLQHGRLIPTADQHLLEQIHQTLQTQNIIAGDGYQWNAKAELAVRQQGLANAIVMPFESQNRERINTNSAQTIKTSSPVIGISGMSKPNEPYDNRDSQTPSSCHLSPKIEKKSIQIPPERYTQRHVVYTSHYGCDSLFQRWKCQNNGSTSPLKHDDSTPKLKHTSSNSITTEQPNTDHYDTHKYNTNQHAMDQWKAYQCDFDNVLTTLRKSNAGAVMTTLQDLMGIECTRDDFLSWRFNWEQITDDIRAQLSALSRR